MAETAGDVMVETLLRWGVDTVFGIPGDGVNGVIEALRTRCDRIRFVQTRHEEAAAFMACGYAKWTGRLGVCLATSGPGGIHLLNGLYDAKLDGAPVLAITGLQFHDLVATHTQQDVELDKLFQDVAVYNAANKSTPGLTVLGLKEGGVDVAIDEDNAKLVTPAMKAKVEAARADIIAGKIKVADYMANNSCTP